MTRIISSLTAATSTIELTRMPVSATDTAPAAAQPASDQAVMSAADSLALRAIAAFDQKLTAGCQKQGYSLVFYSDKAAPGKPVALASTAKECGFTTLDKALAQPAGAKTYASAAVAAGAWGAKTHIIAEFQISRSGNLLLAKVTVGKSLWTRFLDALQFWKPKFSPAEHLKDTQNWMPQGNRQLTQVEYSQPLLLMPPSR